jgi:uncharacterized coiled-coil DUF342 family protein
MCLCDKTFPSETALAFLEELRATFSDSYSPKELENALAYSLNTSFKDKIKGKMEYYNKHTDVGDSITKLKKGIEDMKNSIVDASDVLSQRGEKINLIVKKADSLRQESASYYGGVKLLFNYRQEKLGVLLGGEG